MAIIKKLSEEVASQVAAGEVIERPINVIKELIENACDAKAEAIFLEITEGGLGSIRITDNGIGISEEDLPMALERFATSKAETVEEVYSASTFGFRGEALAAISTVSDFKIISKYKDSPAAFELASSYGNVGSVKPASLAKGTVIEANKLFERFPARRKFLKSVKSLESEVLRFCKHFSLINPNIELSLKIDGKEAFHVFKHDTILDRSLKVFPNKPFFEGKASFGGTSVLAITTLPSGSDRLKKDALIIGVNGRLIKDTSLMQAIIAAYFRLIPDGRYPITIINITINPSEVDCNVHPAKMEVRFKNGSDIFHLVKDSVKNAIEGKGVSFSYDAENKENGFDMPANMAERGGEMSFATPSSTFKGFGNSGYKGKSSSSYSNTYNSNGSNSSMPYLTKKEAYAKNDILEYTEARPYLNIERNELLTVEDEIRAGNFSIVGQIDKTYIVVETFQKRILFIDQHVAHERILFEKINAERTHAVTINLHTEVEVLLGSEIVSEIMSFEKELKNFGYTFKITGFETVALLSVPINMANKNIEREFELIVSDLIQKGTSKREDAPRAMLSCKSAIKAGDPLRQEEMQYLVSLLFRTDNFGTCPHGRPIIYSITLKELAQRFYRS